MAYDFRKQAGERNFLDNFEREVFEIETKANIAVNKVAKKYLNVVRDLLENFNLKLDVNKSWVQRYKIGSDSWGISGALVGYGDLPVDGIEGAIWDVTSGLKCKVTKTSNSWRAEFNVGG